MYGGGFMGVFRPPDPEEGARRPSLPFVHSVTSDYLATLGTRVVQGRGFTVADRAGATPVLIVSQRTAEAYWPGAEAVGQCLRRGDRQKRAGGRLSRPWTAKGRRAAEWQRKSWQS